MRTGIYDKNWNAHDLIPKIRSWGASLVTVGFHIYIYIKIYIYIYIYIFIYIATNFLCVGIFRLTRLCLLVCFCLILSVFGDYRSFYENVNACIYACDIIH